IVAGVAGASLSANIILILGFANLIADGISMAVGDYLSTKAEVESHKNKILFKKILRKKFKSIDSGRSPLKSGAITFFSFFIFGFIPLLVYILQLFYPIKNAFIMSIILTGGALLILGGFKSKITGKSWIKSGIETFTIGSIAAGVAYYIGYFVSTLI
ncbi:MAG: VIT1/CCC1 transporter family protein, partial [Candidatus Pacearchaeota archaeon]